MRYGRSRHGLAPRRLRCLPAPLDFVTLFLRASRRRPGDSRVPCWRYLLTRLRSSRLLRVRFHAVLKPAAGVMFDFAVTSDAVQDTAVTLARASGAAERFAHRHA